MTSEISEVPALTPALADAVRRLADDSPGAADNPPISERGLLHLTAPQPVRHLIARGHGRTEPDGYAQLDEAEGDIELEIVATTPAVAASLLAAARAAAPGRRLLLWAHGTQSVAGRAAQAAGLSPVRSLHQLRRGLSDLDATHRPYPDGVTIRSFRPGFDDAGWLAVNARAFATHPEQGGWTQRDLEERIASDWFDPAGFLIAERDGEIIGFHWTKVHSNADEPIGEVYVIGVDPAAQGLRLGKLLLQAGLDHLRASGLSTVLLYVDATNTTAVTMYERQGFTLFSTDTQYAIES